MQSVFAYRHRNLQVEAPFGINVCSCSEELLRVDSAPISAYVAKTPYQVKSIN